MEKRRSNSWCRPAGYVSVIRVSQLGGKATLIGNDALGETYLNRGYMPTKVLARIVTLPRFK